MRAQTQSLAHSRSYWVVLLLVALTMIGVALYYQYALEELPCVLCIHTRIWVSALILIALFALTFRREWLVVTMHGLSVVCAAGLLERSYQLLGTERGFIFSDCGFDLGLPAWLALDKWLAPLFRVETSCGYTPELFAGITMAEGLMALSTILLLISLTLTMAALLRQDY